MSSESTRTSWFVLTVVQQRQCIGILLALWFPPFRFITRQMSTSYLVSVQSFVRMTARVKFPGFRMKSRALSLKNKLLRTCNLHTPFVRVPTYLSTVVGISKYVGKTISLSDVYWKAFPQARDCAFLPLLPRHLSAFYLFAGRSRLSNTLTGYARLAAAFHCIGRKRSVARYLTCLLHHQQA